MDELFGRRGEFESLDRLWEARTTLITVVGPGGVGKTTLVDAWLAGHVHHGEVLRTDLSEVRSLDDVLYAVARSLDVPLPQDTLDLSSQVLRLVASRGPSLWVLDNVEQIEGGFAAFVAALLHHVGTTILTSRHALRLRQEVLLELAPLTVPAEGSTPQQIASADAVALFTARARRVRRDFAVTPGNADDVAAIVRQLDGLPLSLELAAARLGVLDEHGLRRRLVDALRLTTNGAHDLPARQRSLRSTMDWSWDLLSDGEQAVLAQISILRAPFDADAAEAVAEALDGESVLDAVDALRGKSLLVVDHTVGGLRFRMLDHIRTYARERLLASERWPDLEERHARWCADHAERCAAGLDGHDGRGCRARLRLLLDDLRAAHQWARSADRGELFGRLTLALDAALRDCGAIHQHATLLERSLLEIADPTLRRRVLLARVRLEPSERWLDEADTQAHASGDALLAGWTHLSRATAAADDVPREVVRGQLEHALAAGVQARDLELEVLARTELARMLLRTAGAIDEALVALESARRAAQRGGSLRHLAWTEGTRAAVLHAMGRPSEAAATYLSAAEMLDRVGDDRFRAWMLAQRAVILQEHGRLDEAEEAFVEAIAVARPFGDRWHAAIAALAVQLAHERGPDPSLVAAYEEVATTLAEHGLRMLLVPVVASLGALHAQLGEPDASRRALARAQRMAGGHPTLRWVVELHGLHLERLLERQALDRGDADGAAAHGRRIARALAEVTSQPRRSEDLRFAERLLRPPTEEATAQLVIGPAGRWFRVNDRSPVDLSKHRALRAVLVLLAERAAAGMPATVADLQAAAWPTERLVRKSGQARVYVALNRLREQGLRPLLRRSRSGWWLAATVAAPPEAGEDRQADPPAPEGRHGRRR